MPLITPFLLRKWMPHCPDPALWAPALDGAAYQRNITTPKRLAAWIATLAHESADLTKLEEDLHYTAHRLVEVWETRFTMERDGSHRVYAPSVANNPEAIANIAYSGRMGNGPATSGDGYAFRGRSMGLTGRQMYSAAGAALGLPLVTNPDLVAKDPVVAARVAAWIWLYKGCNRLADLGDMDAITQRINGGTIGLADRKRRYAQVLAQLGG